MTLTDALPATPDPDAVFGAFAALGQRAGADASTRTRKRP